MDYSVGIFLAALISLICSPLPTQLAPTTAVPTTAEATVTTATGATGATGATATVATVPTEAPNTASTGAANTASTAAPTAAPTEAPTTPAAPVDLDLKWTVTIASVTMAECEKVKGAGATTLAPMPAATTAGGTAATNAATSEATEATTDAATVAAATTAAVTVKPLVADEGNDRRRRRAADAFDEKTFLVDAKKKFEEFFKTGVAVEGVTVKIDEDNIVCGSIKLPLQVTGKYSGGTVDDFTNSVADASAFTIQGRAVTKGEINTMIGKDAPKVTTGGLTGGAIAGIVIGVLVLIVIVVVVVLQMKKGQKSATISSNSRVKLSEVAE